MMTYDPAAHKVLHLMEIYGACDIEQGTVTDYDVHKIVGPAELDVAELRYTPEYEIDGVTHQDPPALIALRRINVMPDGSFSDTDYMPLDKWVGHKYTAEEVGQWDY